MQTDSIDLSPTSGLTDARCMAIALELAREAADAGEVPVGAVVVHGGRIVGRGRNRTQVDRDPTAHAEVVALRAAAAALGGARLDGATLHVTLEPCLMCCGALLEARIERLAFGAREPRTGAVLSAFETLMPAARLGHRVAIVEGECAAASAALMREFFARRRD